MKQVVQATSGGGVRVIDVPVPVIGPTEVLVRTVATVVSPGTERAMTSLAQANLFAKAKARPDLVRKVVAKARADGVGQAVRSAQQRLATDLPLGYSGCGYAVEVGSAVAGVRPGDLVATGGAGRANHAEYQAVPGLLCAVVPDPVAPADAAFTTVASIALHGLRLAEVGPGSRVVVIGLGLVGQLATRLALASGCEVAGIDVANHPVAVAAAAGARSHVEAGEATTAAVIRWSRGRGADAVLICAAGRSSDPVMRAAALARDRAQVVVVGDVGLDLRRTPFYDKELSLRFARSYGPGRYEQAYEDWGVDYPAGAVRWTEGRNFEAVLDLLASGRFEVADLVTHAFPVTRAPAAYEVIAARREPYLAIRFDYPDSSGRVPSQAAGEVPRPRPNPQRQPQLRPQLQPPVQPQRQHRPPTQTEHQPPPQPQTQTGTRTRSTAASAAASTGAPTAAPTGASGGGGAPRRGTRVGWIGAGTFSSGVLLPAFRAAGFTDFRTVAAAGGLTAQAFADRHGFAAAASGAAGVLDDDEVDVVVVATPHASHAEIAAAALRRGKHVWCEKPLALTLDELDAVDKAAVAGGGVLMVGYNRRWSPVLAEARAQLMRRAGPASVVYRVAAGPVPDEHWYADRVHGGRLLGEVCHFVDTCSALVGAEVEVATALAGRDNEALLAADFALALRHTDGSLSTVAYSSARPRGCRKERIEAMAGSRHVLVDDFREIAVDGRSVWRGNQDKGHEAAASAFLAACQAGGTDVTATLLASSRATLAAAAALSASAPVRA